MFLKNTWYVACTPDEIDGGKPLGRRICGEAVVLYRGAGGVAVALEDFCPHRGAPLSLGRVNDGVLTCGYQGLQMGDDGKTVAMPGQRVRGFPPIRKFPVVERHGFVWIWPGDAALADPAAIHPLQILESQQRNLLAHPTRSLLKLNIDAGGVRARAVLDRLLAAETGPHAAAR